MVHERVARQISNDINSNPSWSLVYGRRKVGKTFLALEWAHCLALGKPWLDFAAVPIRVLYCSAEGNRTLGERTKALREAREMDPPAGLRFLPGSRR
ncbi:MAG: AAA family ATPase, partial [Candidatus Thermoplasmatota archaeon]|nr:AAA family ATPase [Candidatus Thermoplasmatota archaeon]